MTKRVINTRLTQELAWTSRSRREPVVGEAVADLHRLTLEAFGDAEPMQRGFVVVTLFATTPRQDGFFRPYKPWMVGMATYPIPQALEAAGIIQPAPFHAVLSQREFVETAEEERIEVELIEAGEAAA